MSAMTRVQVVMPDEERDRFSHQARSEGMTLSAWLRAAACERLEERQQIVPFEAPAELERFFRTCDTLEGPEIEPDWHEHLAVINESRRYGTSNK